MKGLIGGFTVVSTSLYERGLIGGWGRGWGGWLTRWGFNGGLTNYDTYIRR